MLNRQSDEALAGMAQKGDTKAFEELFKRYKRPILNFVYRLIGNRETAEEVAQEAFMKAYKNLDIFDVTKRFSPWIYTIARNLAKNALRDKKYFRDVSLDTILPKGDGNIHLMDVIADSSVMPDEIAENEELAQQAQRVLDSLPFEYKEVITLCSIQGLIYEEAAQIIGCSTATVSVRLNKAKELFIKRLKIE